MRKFKTIIILLTVILASSVIFGQEAERWKITKKQAGEIIHESLSDSTHHNVIGLRPILTKRKKVIEFAELILWDIYEKRILRNKNLTMFF